jgi:hypothetical protein
MVARTKNEAFANGEMHFFNGKPCKYGHLSARKRASGNCLECLKTVYAEKLKAGKRRHGQRIAKQKRERERKGVDRDKYLARSKVEMAIRSGRLVKQPCERCGESEEVHAHHDDYSKPLDVMWLCPLHHRQRHKEPEAISLIEDEASDV